MGRSLEFQDLPLLGVEMRVQFATPFPGLSLAVACNLSFFAKDRGYSPALVSQRQLPAGESPNVLRLISENMPGMELQNATSGIALTIQNDLLVVAWNRLLVDPAPYPRFDAMRTELSWALESLPNCWQADTPAVKLVNMSYINFVPETGTDVPFLSGRCIPPIAESRMEFHEINLRWRHGPKIDRALQVSQAESLQTSDGTSLKGYLLKTVTGSLLEESDQPLVVIERCHDDLQEFFVEAISDRAKSDWGLIEGG